MPLNLNYEDLHQWCAVRETAPEVGRAIWLLAFDATQADRIWAGTDAGLEERIAELAFERTAADRLRWGAANIWRVWDLTHHNGARILSGGTLREAAHAILSYDDHVYEILPSVGGHELWTSGHSRNSTAFSGTNLTLFVPSDNLEDATRQIYLHVLKHADRFAPVDADERFIL